MTALLFTIITDVTSGLAPLATIYTVYDGPVPTSDTPTTYIVIGADGQGGPGYEFVQDWADFAGMSEDGQIHCQLVSHNGDGDVALARGYVATALADLATVVQAINHPGAQVHLGPIAVTPRQVEGGAEVEALVDVIYTGFA